MAAEILTPERVRELLHYNPETGQLTWKVTRGSGRSKAAFRVFPGDIAGSLTPYGYIVVGVDLKIYRAHRLAWAIVTGEWPRGHIDHINSVRSDNRWHNLRDVTRQVNIQNQRRAQRSNMSSDLIGARWHKRRERWVTSICVDNKDIHIGYFDTAQEAHEAYVEAKRRLHDGCTI